MPLYEVSLKIRRIETASESSYYEVWRIVEVTHKRYYDPILEQVFKRDEIPFNMPGTTGIWETVVCYPKDQKDIAFSLGKKLIREEILERKLDTVFMVEK
jgi:hypothetical protein